VSVAALLQQKPVPAHGTPLGVGDWRYVVEVLLPTPTSGVWGSSLWGSGLWTTYEWVDLTPWCRGEDWARGSDERNGRPRVGDARITLDADEGRWNPWIPSPPIGLPSFFGVGTIVRIGCASATDTRANGWLPQFTGIVDQWTPEYKGARAVEKFVDVLLVETLRDLATTEENGSPLPVGEGENPVQRFERLLGDAEWKYGLIIEAGNLVVSPGSYPLLGTTMSANRLAECYQVADSCDVQFRSDRTGAAIATNIEYAPARPGGSSDILMPLGAFSKVGGLPMIGFSWAPSVSTTPRWAPYDIDSFKSSNSDDSIMNEARYSRPGGAVQSFAQLESIARFGRRTQVRTDLLCTNDAEVRQIAQYMTIRRGLNTLRVDGMQVSPIDHGLNTTLITLAADVQSVAVVLPPDMATGPLTGRPYIYGFVASVRHQVRPMNPNRVQWTATFGIDTRTVHNIPGAQLTATSA
jgi:hypothetical protein